MLGPIPELECQIPELGCTDEIQNYLHGSANADDPFRVMDAIDRGARLHLLCASMRPSANQIEVPSTLVIIRNSHRLCRHKSELPCRMSSFEVNLDLAGRYSQRGALGKSFRKL